MYVNDRNEINYHGFLRAMREMNQVSQECVSKGVCTVSAMNRFENGNRGAEKMMRDRITSRLGISGEKYEDYLQPKEYVRWEQRLRIVQAIEKRELETAKNELSDYAQIPGLNRVNKQFVEAMRFAILSLEGASDEELLECINKAVKHTVFNREKALAGAHLLADQEINLLAEQIRLTSPKKARCDVNTWRITEYEKLISYMESSHWEKLQKAKVYPKVTYDICQLILKKEATEGELRRGLALCHTAIELLRDTCRLYYFVELTQMRRELAARLMDCEIDPAERMEIEDMLMENHQWENVFMAFYAEHKKSPYMSDFCYLYYETECHNMVDVIESRRTMLGLSRVRLGDGICSERTIIRFERQGKNPSIDVARKLFEKMDLCAEYRRSLVVPNDGEDLNLYIKLTHAINGLRKEEARHALSELKSRLNMDISYNKQELQRLENLMDYKEGKITGKELHNKAADTLALTLPICAVAKGMKKGRTYVTRAELTCLYDMAFYGEGESAKIAKQFIYSECERMLQDEPNPSRLSEYELLLSRYASELGDEGRYEESNEISYLIVKECLSYRRMQNLYINYYNILWNRVQTQASDMKRIAHADLERCLILSKVMKDTDWIAFLQNKIGELSH